MKDIRKIAFCSLMALGLSSCGDSFFDVQMDQNIETKDAYKNVQDVKNGMIGAYYALGQYRFYGRNVVAIGDLCSDLAEGDPSSGHFVNLGTYQFGDTDGDIEDMWNYGYKIVDRCVRTIQGAEAIRAAGADEGFEDQIDSYISQCYALRALTTFTMTNLWGKPYKAGGNNTQLGVCLLDKEPLEPFVKIQRSTVEDCYKQVCSDIELALKYYAGEGEMNGSPQFYFNEAAIYALKARVNLYMGKYAEALAAAKEAIKLRGSSDISNEAYVSMWSSTAISDEDILTIAKSDDDNLSANSLNTLYGDYGASFENEFQDYFGEDDARASMLANKSFKFCGTSTSEDTSNIPIFRKSELYLIIAECQTQLGNIEAAREALAYTVKRDLAFVDEDGNVDISILPDNKVEMMSFIQDEYVREFYQEGHRWFDARRWGLKLTCSKFKNFDVSNFVFPIPADEINAGFCTQQNDGWEDMLPNKK